MFFNLNFNDRRPLVLATADGRVIGGYHLTEPMADSDQAEQSQTPDALSGDAVDNSMLGANDKLEGHVSSDDLDHRRGCYQSATGGISYGGGQKVRFISSSLIPLLIFFHSVLQCYLQVHNVSAKLRRSF